MEEGTTTTNHTPEAKLHKTTVRTGVIPLFYREHRIFLLDAPGYGDFVGEIRGALEAADAALVAVSAESEVFREGRFEFAKGPLFAQVVLADEVSRAAVQSALLEATEERTVTFGGVRHPLPKPFLVLATQNLHLLPSGGASSRRSPASPNPWAWTFGPTRR